MNNAEELEQLSELLNVIAVNLIEADQENALYLIIQKKMNATLHDNFTQRVVLSK